MHKNKIHQSTSSFDFIYINPDYENFSEILTHQKNGLNTMVVFEHDLIRNDIFQITETFPYRLIEFPSKIKEYKIWEKTILTVPHLFQLQKIFYPGSIKFKKHSTKTADFFYKNTFHKKAEFVTQNQNISFLNSAFREGIFFQEFRFNYSRFFIEIVKYFEKCGGVVKINQTIQHEKNKLIFNSTHQNFTAQKIVTCKSAFKSVLKIPIKTTPGFSMAASQNRRTIHFYNSENELIAESAKNSSREDLLNISQIYFEFNPEETKSDFIPANISVQTLHQIILLLDEPLNCNFNEIDFKDLSEFCNDKYDLAKQTGISFADFKILFHRYGKGIDEMIENAYEQMHQIRDSKIIWESSEEGFQKKYEWGI